MNFHPKRWLLMFTGALLLLGECRPAVARSTPVQERTRALLEQEKFAELDELAAEYRRTKERTRNGGWLLDHIYLGAEVDEDGRDVPDAELEHRESLLRKWMATRTNSMTARVALAAYLIDRGRERSGIGFAPGEAAKRRRRVDKLIVEAREVLEAAKALPGLCPAWYHYMQLVALAEGWDRERFKRLYEEAVAFEPDEQEYYVNYARYFLPQWYGKGSEWHAAALDAAERTQARWGEAYYTRVCAELFRYLYPKEILTSGAEWKRLLQGFRDILKKYPDSEYWLNQMAHRAVHFEDRATAREAFERMKEKPDPDVWGERSRKESVEHFNECLAWAEPATVYNPPIDPKELAELKIVNARYGTGGKFADVTRRVDELIHTPAITFFARPNSLGVDPNHGWNKELTVTYDFHGQRYAFKTGENGRVSAWRLVNETKKK